MKVLLLSIKSSKSEDIEEPGLGILAAVAEKSGHCVKVMQFTEDQDYMKIIVEFAPEFIGFTTYDRHFISQAICAEKIKNSNPFIKICFGGYTATYHPMEIIQNCCFVDFIIIGEGEKTILQLLTALENKTGYNHIKGLVYKGKDSIHINEGLDIICDLDELPFANRDLLSSNNLVQLSTTRGCMASCTFCCSKDFWRNDQRQRIFRRMSATRVVDEIEYIYNKYGKNRFVFNDNSYEDPQNDTQRQLEIAKEILKRNLKVNYNVNYRVGFYKYAPPDFINYLISSGLSSVFLGVESGNNDDLLLYNKRITVNDAYSALEYFQQFENLIIMIGFINFNPYTTLSRLYENVGFLKKTGFCCDVSNFSSRLIPFKGTNVFEKIKKDGLLRGNIFDGGYEFQFLNKDVEIIYEYIQEIVKENKNIKESHYLCSILPNIIINIKRIAFENDNSNVINLINDTQNKFYDIKNNLNDVIATWINTLLDTVKTEWNSDIVKKYTNEYLNDYKVIESYSDLMILRNKLYLRLIKISPEFKYIF